MMNHSPEPWDFVTADNAPNPHVGVYAHDDTFVCSLGDYVPADILRLPEVNAERIVQCVNGCVGMEDPPMDILRLSDVAAEADTLSQALIELLRDYARNDAWARDLLRQTVNLGTNARKAFTAVNR